MLDGNEVVLHRIGFAMRGVEDLHQTAGRLRRSPATRTRQVTQFGLYDSIKLLAVGADLLHDRREDAFLLRDQRGKQVQRLDLRISAVGSELLGSLHGLLGFDREFVESYGHLPPTWSPLLRIPRR